MNTEPDEYHCACPQGYSGKNCQIGERESSLPSLCEGITVYRITGQKMVLSRSIYSLSFTVFVLSS